MRTPEGPLGPTAIRVAVGLWLEPPGTELLSTEIMSRFHCGRDQAPRMHRAGLLDRRHGEKVNANFAAPHLYSLSEAAAAMISKCGVPRDSAHLLPSWELMLRIRRILRLHAGTPQLLHSTRMYAYT